MTHLSELYAAARRALGAQSGVEIHVFDTLDSTSSEAKRHATAETVPALYIARTQTGGRGRLGRSFHSPDTGIYMTLAYTTDRPLTETVHVTALAAVAAVAAIEDLTAKRPAIKWVNDLYLDGGKLAGILTEAVTLTDRGARILVGIGVNLTTTDFPSDLRAPAVSLFSAEEAGAYPLAFPAILAGEIARRLLDLVGQPAREERLPDGEECLSFYRRHLLYMGRQVDCLEGAHTFSGVVRGVSDDYALLMEVNGQPRALSSGEISIRVAE